MPDSSIDAKPSAAIPSWQTASASETPKPTQADDKLEVARRFLEEDQVKSEPREKQVAFLKTKGVSDDDIEKLLGDTPMATTTTTAAEKDESSTEKAAAPPPVKQQQQQQQTSTERAPIVTYPEFLTKPQRPPPLVTTNGLLNTLYACVGLSTLVYGASKYVVAPMVDQLNHSRGEIQETVASQLDSLITQLEKTVSVIPPQASSAAASHQIEEESDSEEDPAEMFHRDIGTQTSFPSVTPKTKDAADEAPVTTQHATRLSKLAKSISGLRDDVQAQSTSFEGMKAQLDAFHDDLDAMTFNQDVGSSAYEMFGAPRKTEPNDEIRAVRDNIRRIKGVLLSTRTFPASTR